MRSSGHPSRRPRHRSRRRSRVPSRRRRRCRASRPRRPNRPSRCRAPPRALRRHRGVTVIGIRNWVCTCSTVNRTRSIASAPTTVGITAGAARSAPTGRGKRRTSRACRVVWDGSSGSNAKGDLRGRLICGAESVLASKVKRSQPAAAQGFSTATLLAAHPFNGDGPLAGPAPDRAGIQVP
ncbi:hypothetical protein D3C76_875590 [compost metagenome]